MTTTLTARTTPAARRRRLRVRVAMVGTLTGLAVSLATPAMAASAPTAAAPPAAVSTASAPAPHASTAGAPTSGPTSPEHLTRQEKYQAYLDSAYTYDDAEQLAAYWGTRSVRQAKVRIGGKLLTGVALPFAPKATPPKTAPKTGPKSGVVGAQLDAFYGAGYGYADAEVLAGYWSSPTPYDAKLTGGAKIKAGSTLPFPPKSTPKTGPKSEVAAAQLDAFYGAGYGYADAEVLAGYWHLSSPYDAKLTGGAKIKAGTTLPFPPKSDPAAVDGDR